MPKHNFDPSFSTLRSKGSSQFFVATSKSNPTLFSLGGVASLRKTESDAHLEKLKLAEHEKANTGAE